MKYELFHFYNGEPFVIGEFNTEAEAKAYALECMKSGREKLYIRIKLSPYYKPAI